MNAQIELPYNHLRAESVRLSLQARIRQFFFYHPGERFDSDEMHHPRMFGRKFASRVSEINKERDCLFYIKSRTWTVNGKTHCEYWAEEK